MAVVDQEVDSRLPAGSFRQACRQLDVFTCLEQALLVSEGETIAGDWSANPALAEVAAEHVRRTCDLTSGAVQIQYACLEPGGDARLLYVRPAGGCLVTLVTRSDVTLSRLRQLADSLAEYLEQSGAWAQSHAESGPGLPDERPAGFGPSPESEAAYAIAWRPVEPLPRSIRKIIRESARRLATQKGCQLSFIGVASDHVHLVLRCPARRKGSWLAHAFKRGIEEDIAHRFGTSASLWQKGYLADESADPLGGNELLAYLNH